MTAPILVDKDFRSNRHGIREVLDGAVRKHEPVIGFLLGFIGLLALALAGCVAMALHFAA